MFFSFAFSVFLLTQPTRYMGIETLTRSGEVDASAVTQPTRYMGIETLTLSSKYRCKADTTYSLYGY